MIWFAPDLRRALGWIRPNMLRVFNLRGRIFREPAGANRRTLRFEAGGRGWFLKLHWGVGWGEILKNLLALRLPVLGAMPEWRAIRRLEGLGVQTMTLAGYGREGWNPARLRSFVITEELTDSISLEDYCAAWPENPPASALKWTLIRRLADVSHRLHHGGVNHRDYYLCHFLLRLPWDGTAASLRLPLIDLHRVQLRRRTPERWRVKDIGSLWFSAMQIGLTRRDLLRFARIYGGGCLRSTLERDRGFWQAVEVRAQDLDKTRPPPKPPDGKALTLALAGDAGSLSQLRPVRSLPGKRWVGLAEWQGRRVFAKLFQDPRRARVHWQRELDGLQALEQGGIRGPEILFSGETLAEQWPVLLLAPIEPAQSLLAAWNAWDRTERRYWLGRLVALLARQHQAGVVQTDLHLDNFLLSEGGIHSLDGAGIRSYRNSVGETESLDNLALLLAQLLPDCDVWREALYIEYLAIRGWDRAPSAEVLAERVTRAREGRWREYRGKLFRDCTQIERGAHPYGLRLLERVLADEPLRQLLADPDASFPGVEEVLKNGNTCTVWATRAGDRRLVVKRYNVKNFWHGLRLSLRRGRAFSSWEAAHLLGFFGIATPKPLALARERRGWLRPVAYFVSEYVPGTDALSWFRDPAVSLADKGAMAERMGDLLRQLKQQRIVHGDLKATNILIGPDGPALIDLDALRRYPPGRRFDRAWQRDLERFTVNWQDRPELAALFAGAFARVLNLPEPGD